MDKVKPIRIQRKRTKGWRMPHNTVYVGRPTTWGNPFTIDCDAFEFSFAMPWQNPINIEQVLDDYREYVIVWEMISSNWAKQLKGKNLACWCPLDQPCHADILLEMANS